MYSCPAGYYINKVGAKSQNECIMCPMGYYCVANSLLMPVITPEACPAGTYSNRAGL